MGLGGAERPLITGEVDSVQIDWGRRVMHVEGRDLAARLIEARTQESFQNRTGSEIAEILAGRHGLKASVTSTTTPVGRYYQLERDRVTLNQYSRATTEWDLLTWLARQEGFDLYVAGTTLHFEQPSAALPAVFTPADLIDLRMERAVALAGDMEVTVKSWHSRRQSAFTQTARVGDSGSAGRSQRYVVVRPNLTADEALSLAHRLLADIARHQSLISLIMPGEFDLTARSRIALNGTGTAFDRTYAVSDIERSLSAERGFIQTVRGRDLPAQSAGGKS